MIKRLLFQIARSPVASSFIGFAFAHLSWLMPVKRIMENERVIVFEHPKPFWETHWLAVPKQRVPSIMACEAETLHHLLPMIQTAARELESPVMLVNAGAYQDVPQLHFHLTSGLDKHGGAWGRERYVGDAGDGLSVTPHPRPLREVHWQVHLPHTPAFLEVEQWDAVVDAFVAAREQAQQMRLTAFTIVWHSAENPLTLHLLSGTN